MLPFMAFAMEMRGSDSWGGSDGNEVIKKVGPIGESFEVPEHWTKGIFHTRAATVGAVSERNAHPFLIETPQRIIGIHNGHVSNWQWLKEKYNRIELEVDSEHIFMHLAGGQPLSELVGRGTIVWFDDEQKIKLARWNFGDLEMAQLEGGEMVFASTKVAIEKAARFAHAHIRTFVAPLADGIEHSIDRGDAQYNNGDWVFNGERLGFGSGYSSSSGGGYHGGDFYGVYNGRQQTSTTFKKEDRNVCWKCYKPNTLTFVCKECTEKYRTEWLKEKKIAV